ncbi:MAG: methionyl-tRNA formyltransferase [Mariprofundaceae bacterium]|nr:methionyl-tRNA formyltransferase [Mariprofundaceae bacterium]
MKVVFAGTPGFAAQCLQALCDDPHIEVVGVITQPDRKAGRGMKLTPSPVKRLALTQGFDCITPPSLKDNTEDLAWLQHKEAHFLVVVAYGMIIPPLWLQAVSIAPINIHASLLPRWRGAAPIERALLAGDTQTGVSIMRMEEGLDTGPVYATTILPISDTTTGQQLWAELAQMGVTMLPVVLKNIAESVLHAVPQDVLGANYAAKLTADDRLIQWQSPAEVIDRQVRCFTAKPGARLQWRQRWLKIISGSVQPCNQTAEAGKIMAMHDGLDVLCGDGYCYRILTLQPEGKAVMNALDFARGQRVQVGDSLQDKGTV